MIGRNSKLGSAASINDVEEILGKRKDLTYEQQLAFDHAKKFASSKAKYETARKALEELGTLDSAAIANILSVMPKGEMALKQVLAGVKKALKDDEVSKVFDIVKKASV
jgi:DNA-directed RNA polymerase subunit F